MRMVSNEISSKQKPFHWIDCQISMMSLSDSKTYIKYISFPEELNKASEVFFLISVCKRGTVSCIMIVTNRDLLLQCTIMNIVQYCVWCEWRK